MVVYAKEINNEVVRDAFKDLEKITDKRYIFKGTTSYEDGIIVYAERLMKPLIKYEDHEEGYDFSKAKTHRQKAEIIGIWAGEILYEALICKDVNAVTSLTRTIKTEIEDLIKEES